MIIYNLLLSVILIVMAVKANCLIVTYRAVLRQRTTTVIVLSLLNAVSNYTSEDYYVYFKFVLIGRTTAGPGSSSGNSGASYVYGVVAAVSVLIIVVIIIIIVIIVRKKYTRHLQQAALGTTPQPSVVRYSTYPSISQQTPQLSTVGETTITSSVPASNPSYYDTEPAAVGSTTNPSVLTSAVKTNTFSSDYPYPPPPYNPSYCKNEYTPDHDECTNCQLTLHGIPSIPPPSYSSVVSTSATTPVPPLTTNI